MNTAGTTSDVEITVDGGVQTLRFNRPDKKNALTGAMYAALVDAFDRGDADDNVAAHVITGSGGVFTAGNDIGDFLAAGQSRGSAGGRALDAPVMQFIKALPRVRKPMIAGVDGPAIGIGTTLLFHCDLVYATPAARFATPFLGLGLVPEAGSSLLMPRRMGYARAFEMLALGATFTADQMSATGLLNAIVAADELEAHALKAARKLAAMPREALSLTRQLMRGDADEIANVVAHEAKIFAERLQSKEAQHAFQAFLQRSG